MWRQMHKKKIAYLSVVWVYVILFVLFFSAHNCVSVLHKTSTLNSIIVKDKKRCWITSPDQPACYHQEFPFRTWNTSIFIVRTKPVVVIQHCTATYTGRSIKKNTDRHFSLHAAHLILPLQLQRWKNSFLAHPGAEPTSDTSCPSLLLYTWQLRTKSRARGLLNLARDRPIACELH